MGFRPRVKEPGLWLICILLTASTAVILTNWDALQSVLRANLEIHTQSSRLSGSSRQGPGKGSEEQEYLIALERGRRALRENESERAVRWLEKARAVRPDSEPARIFLGLGYLRLGKTSKAVSEFKETQLADPGFFPSQRRYNYLIHKAWLSAVAVRSQAPRLRDWNAVERLYLVVRDLYRSDPKSWQSLFDFYQYSARDGDALIRAADEAKRQFPEWVLPYLKTVEVYTQKNLLELALAELDRAAQVAPYDETVYIKAAHILHRRRDFASARDWESRATQALPRNTSVIEAYRALEELEALGKRDRRAAPDGSP